jgi:hypothetical protein
VVTHRNEHEQSFLYKVTGQGMSVEAQRHQLAADLPPNVDTKYVFSRCETSSRWWMCRCPAARPELLWYLNDA